MHKQSDDNKSSLPSKENFPDLAIFIYQPGAKWEAESLLSLFSFCLKISERDRVMGLFKSPSPYFMLILIRGFERQNKMRSS